MLTGFSAAHLSQIARAASLQASISAWDGSFMVITGRLTTSEELGIAVSEDDEPAAEEADDKTSTSDDDEDIDTVADILDVDPDDVAKTINKAKKKNLKKVCKALELEADDYDDLDEMREAIIEDLGLEDWDD